MIDRLKPSQLDSLRFGHRIARVTIDKPDDVRVMLIEAREQAIEMLVIRTNARDPACGQAIEEAGGRLCDTLVHYARSLRSSAAPTPPNVRPAGVSDIDGIAEVAAAAFSGYGGHYHADARLGRDAADAAYVDWARRSTVEHRVWVVESGSVIVGFLALQIREVDAEIVLNAIHPSHQGRGLYPMLVAAAIAESKVGGADRCVVSTQVSNVAAQKAWVRAGFEPSHAVHTFHLWL